MSNQQPESSWVVSYESPSSFGDNWSSAKVLAWTLLDIPRARITPLPTARLEFEDQRSWWLAAIDLLMLGKGWNDLSNELREWRMNSYLAKDPVLTFVKNTWGETLVALEWYLILHPNVNDYFYNSVMNARGHQFEYRENLHSRERDRADVVALYELVRNISEDHPCKQFVDSLIGNEFGDDALEYLIYDSRNFTLGGTDPAHLSRHFSHDYETRFSGIEPTDSITLAHNHAFLTVEKYEGWYHKIHDLHRESTEPENGLTDKEITSITVFVKDLGCLGTFVFDEDMQCFIRSYNAEENNVQNTQYTSMPEMKSPRFGIFLPHDMWVALDLALDKDDAFPNVPVEELRLYSLDSIQLCSWIEYGITDKADKFEEEIWSRSERQWLPGHHLEEEKLRACLIKMAKMGTLDLGERPLDQIINDSDSYDVKPWAAPFVLELWDSMVEFPTALAEIAASDANDYFTLSDLEVENDDGLRKIIGDMYDSIVSSDELAAMGKLPALLRGESLSAYEILSNLVDYPY